MTTAADAEEARMGAREMAWKRGILLALLLLAWEVLPRLGVVSPLFIPPPSAVLSALRDLGSSGELATHALLSVRRAAIGFAVGAGGGAALGLLLGGWFPRLQIALEPLMELFAQANPLILFHVIILFLGVGEAAKAFVIGWLCLWPVAFSTINGIRTADPLILKAARSLGLSRWALFLRVAVPAATPSLLTGLRLAAGYSFLLLIAAEMMGASSGLGWLIVQSQESYSITRIFAGAIVITALAVSADAALKLLGRRFLAHAESGADDYVALTGGTGRA